ncbi:MAG: hypothetical protein KDC91_03310 [Flavobacteriaceae bacterium]|nr:hypothetical protein [Flavobacteriaceae bacterium]
MKNFFKILGISAFVLGVTACAGGKEYLLEKNPPFSIKEAYFQKWVAGVQGGGSGTNLHITLSNIKEDITIEEIYFGDKLAKANKNPQNIDLYTANFLNDTNRDIIMDGDATKEAKNVIPQVSPFSLSEKEAVISYSIKGEMYYYKITNLDEKPILAYPSSNPNGRN